MISAHCVGGGGKRGAGAKATCATLFQLTFPSDFPVFFLLFFLVISTRSVADYPFIGDNIQIYIRRIL